MFAVMRRCGLAAAVMVGVLLTVTWSGVAAASPRPLPLSARLLRAGDFPGFTLEAPRSLKTAKAWVAGDTSLTPAQAGAQVARLTREGFKEVLVEYLDDTQGPRNGVSFVMQLGSAASARAELAAEVRYEKAYHAPLTFQVSTIPGAVGFGGSGGENVVFADGPFLYLVGNAWGARSTRNPRHAALIEAATKLYQRVHGHPAAQSRLVPHLVTGS
jgi:hypothetical protein